MLSEQSQYGQDQSVRRYRNQMFRDVPPTMRRMFWEIIATQQSSFQQITAFTARRGNHFVDRRFPAPYKRSAAFCHAAKEVHIFATRVKFRTKPDIVALQDRSPEEHITRTSLFPSQFVSCLVVGTLEETTVHYPLRGRGLKLRQHRPQHPIDLVFAARRKKVGQPP